MSAVVGLLAVQGYIAAMAGAVWIFGRRDDHESAATRYVRRWRDRP